MGILLLNNSLVFFPCVIAIIPLLFLMDALSICYPSQLAFIPTVTLQRQEECRKNREVKFYFFFFGIGEPSILGQWDIGVSMTVLLSFEKEWALLMMNWVRYRIFSFWMGWISHSYNELAALWEHFQKQNYFACVYQDGWKQMKVLSASVLASWKFWCGSLTQLLSALGKYHSQGNKYSGNKYYNILAWA